MNAGRCRTRIEQRCLTRSRAAAANIHAGRCAGVAQQYGDAGRGLHILCLSNLKSAYFQNADLFHLSNLLVFLS